MTPASKSGPIVNDASTAPSDGGRIALSGFLYQMLAALALKGHSSVEPDAAGISALFSLARDASVVHEGYDADIVLLKNIDASAQQGIVFIQCKFSNAGSGSQIYPEEFRAILDRMHAAAKVAYKRGKNVSGFFLVTNRVYSPGTLKIIASLADTGKSNELNRIQNCVARNLRLQSEIQPEFWDDQLRGFAKTFGILPEEYQSGKERLLGRLLGKPHCEVNVRMLVECLTGSPEARTITHASVRAALDLGLRELGPAPAHTVIDRPSAESALALHLNRALILCVGPGGTGKTASLRKWAKLNAETRFVASRRPARVVNDWIPVQINEWRGLPSRSESAAAALSRIEVANPDMKPPIFFLCLDGVDERITVGPNTHHLCAILEWFWKEDERVRQEMKGSPKARLIVTCRRIEDFDQIWWPNTSSSPGISTERPPAIPFSDFTDEEFATILQIERRNLNNDVFVSLMRTTSAPIGLTDEEASTPQPSVGSAFNGQSDSPEIVLRHPAMWEAFATLPESTKRAFLNREHAAEDAVAALYVARFLAKAAARSESLDGRTIRLAFIKIAAATHTCTPAIKHKRSIWNDMIGRELALGIPCADGLFIEALSAGIIDDDYDAWVWRFPFVHRYLAAREKRP